MHTKYFFQKTFIFLIIIASFWETDVFAGLKDDVGYTMLSGALGSSTPDGTGVWVTQVEAPVTNGEWMPDPGNSQFDGKTLNDMSGSGGLYSSHATTVAYYFFGNTASMAPGVSVIDCFSINHWLASGYLRVSDDRHPLSSSSRISNHSWVGTSPGYASEILRRLDWVIDRDEFIQTVANCVSGSPLMGDSFNSIVVGRTSGESGSGTVYVDSDYTGGRQNPHIVAPQAYLSNAIPVISSIAGVLVEAGHTKTYLSNDPYITYRTNRSGNRIYNAERSEVIKAVLMAGADRFTHNTTQWDITTYRTDPVDQTENGLDKRYGAGQLNIYNSYFILAGGEQNCEEDAPEGGGHIGWDGFDYDPYFGGVSGSNDTSSYYFTADENHSRLAATLIWNISINGGTYYSFNGNATLYDMDLLLFDVTDPENPVLSACSMAEGVNQENLWVPLEKGTNYCIQVRKGSSQSDFLWDYALAWHLQNDGDRDAMPDYWELENLLDPDNPNDADKDPDFDGLPNSEEYTYGTDPGNSDTDEDEFPDGYEVKEGYDPLDPASHLPYEVPSLSVLTLVCLTGVFFFLEAHYSRK
ncbi:MAG: hypothetical protein KJ737_22715 [Proteobacteria bacterium]|nr:hypothetical protein [Pseudomonadota bacterium]